MSLRRRTLLSIFFLTLLFVFSITIADAQECLDRKISGNTAIFPSTVSSQITIEYTVDPQTVTSGDRYLICTDHCNDGLWGIIGTDYVDRDAILGDPIIIRDKTANKLGPHVLHIKNVSVNPHNDICTFDFSVVQEDPFTKCELKVTSTIDNQGKEFTPNTTISISGENIPAGYPDYFIKVTGPGVNDQYDITVSGGSFPPFDIKKRLSVGTYKVQLLGMNPGRGGGLLSPTSCQTSFCIAHDGCKVIPISTGVVSTRNICAGDKSGKCDPCFGAGDTWTALGCIKTSSPTAFAAWFLGTAIFIASGIAFILMVFGAIQILTSAGDPERVKGGGQLITSAVSGLIFIIFSIFLLRLIGVDILQLPGFGK